MLQSMLQSNLLWNFALKMRRRHFDFTDRAYIRLIGKTRNLGPSILFEGKDSKYTPYLRLSYNKDDGWYYRYDGECGEANYKEIIEMSKYFIKHDKLRAVRFI